MIDIVDVWNAVSLVLTDALFPGMQTPDANVLTRSIVVLNGSPVPVRVFTEWPTMERFAVESAAGGVNVAIYTMPNVTKLTSRFQRSPIVASRVPTTITGTVSNNTVCFNGVGTAGQIVGVAVGSTGYSLRLQDGQDSTQIAATFAEMIPGASSQSGILGDLAAKPTFEAGGDYTLITEVRRQSQRIVVSVWAGDPASRDAVGAITSAAMADLWFLQLPLGITTEPPLYRGVSFPQMDEKVGVFRREETFDIEYPTVRVEVVPTVLFAGIAGINTSSGIFSSEGPIIS